MSEDIPPIKAFLLTLKQIRHARTRREQGRILDLAETILSHRPAPDQLTNQAERLLKTLGEQSLDVTTWARASLRCSDRSGTFQRPLAELRSAGLVEEVRKGMYKRAAEVVCAPDSAELNGAQKKVKV